MNEIRVFDGSGKLKKVISSQQASKIYWDTFNLDNGGITKKAKRKRKFNTAFRSGGGGLNDNKMSQM